ncbi:fibrinogen-like protein 1 [Ruditapes philippinarum]|uniref:fibrinogen-like protein 1 n=1 Tax=Ruditapes philippinarum TaxID=129788 RepID=UPI00295C08C5|nr:fibrinogen-like protein 1 [Ruditapes philippinarum]
MLIYKSLLCYLYVNSIYGLTLYQINNRLSYIEDRINAESKFRRDDFGSLYHEISSMKEMLQQLMEGNSDGKETKHTDQIKEHTSKELEEKIHRLSIGFKEEKMTNSRIRRKTHELQRQVIDLRTLTDKTSKVLADNLKGIEHLTRKTGEYQNDSKQLQSAFTKIGICSVNFTEQYENKQYIQGEKLDKIKAITEMIQENTEQLKQDQEKSFDDIEYIDNTTKRLEEEIYSIKKFVNRATSCLDLYNYGFKSSGIYQIYIIKQEKLLSVYCDMDTDDGGWTVFQRRQDGSVDFFRDWEDYKTGFGDLNGEFWLGNQYLNLLTDDDKQHELRIDLEDFDGNRAYAKYSIFKILPEEMKYKLEVGGYNGNAGDSLGEYKYSSQINNQMSFTTRDNDNDNKDGGSCAHEWTGAWWYNHCFASHLNGLYSQRATCTPKWKCIIWDSWKGSETSIEFTEMKLR